MKSFHLIISGGVQGIGYRAWLKRQAEKLAIVGWVKNREDGAVEAVIQGDGKNLKQLIQKAKQGPEVGWVESVTYEERPTDTGLTLFEVVY